MCVCVCVCVSVCVYVAQVKGATLKKVNDTGRKCRESRKKLFATFEQRVEGIKCHENLKIKRLFEVKVAKYWEAREILLKNTHN